MCCLSFLHSCKTILTEPALFLALQRLQVCWSHAPKQVIVKLSQGAGSSRMPSSSVLLFKNQINEASLLRTGPRVEIIYYGARNLQSLLYVTHLQPSSPYYHWFCFSVGDFGLFNLLGFFYVCMCSFNLFISPGSDGTLKRGKLSAKQKLLRCKLKGLSGCPGEGEGKDFSVSQLNCLILPVPIFPLSLHSSQL